MRTVFSRLLTLIYGLSLGAGIMTLYWSTVVDRGLKREAEWKHMVDDSLDVARQHRDNAKEFAAIAAQNQTTAQECLALIKTR